MCGSRKYPYLPHGRDWKFQRGVGGGGGGSRVQEIPEEGGGGWCINNIFVFSRPTGSIIPICSIFVCLHFPPEPRTQK